MGKFAFISLIILLFFGIDAGCRILKFSHYGEQNGLSNNVVNTIYSDYRGFLWFGTEDGLNQFDGTSFKVYRHINGDSTSLNNSRITGIKEDGLGNILLSSKFMSSLNPFSKKSKHYGFNKKEGQVFSYNFDHEIFIDSKKDIWVSDLSSFLHIENKSNRISKVKGIGNGKYYKSNIYKDTIWSLSSSDFQYFDTKNKKSGILAIDFGKGDPLFLKRLNKNICMSGFWQKGLYIFDNQSGKKIHLLDGMIVSDAQIVKIFGKRELWVSTYQGLYIAKLPKDLFSLKNKDFEFYTHYENDHHSLSSELILCIYQDTIKQNSIWIGTDKGIDKLNPNSLKFQEYNIVEKGKKVTTNELVRIFVDQSDPSKPKYWLSYWNGTGLIQTDENFHLEKRVAVPESKKEGESEIVSGVIRGKDGKIWIASWSGLIKYDDKIGKIEKIYRNKKKIKGNEKNKILKIDKKIKYGGLSTDRLNTIFQDRKGRIWLGTYNGNLNLFYPEKDSFYVFPSNSGARTLLSDRAEVIYEDKSGNIWIGANGLHKFNERTFDFKVFNQDPEDKKGLPGNVFDIKQDREGKIWVSTDLGLAYLDKTEKKFQVFGTNNGLGSEKCGSMMEDYLGNMWVSTLGGLSCINIKTFIIKNYTTTEGLLSNQLGLPLVSDLNGKLVFTYADRNSPLVRFDPKEIHLKNTKIPLYFTNFNILGRDYLAKKPLNQLGKIVLEFNQNLLSFSFKGLEYDNPNIIKYKYKLEGLDNNWIYLGSVSNITFSNLMGGNYILHVKASNSFGDWMEDEISFEFQIKKPFWEMWWFRILIIVLIGFIIYQIYKYRLRQALKMEQIRINISKDLHDDIGSTLSSISIMSDLMINNHSKGNLKNNNDEMANEIKSSSLELMEKMDDIVWSINPNKDTLEDLMLRIQRFSRQLFEAKEIEGEIIIQEEIGKVKLQMKDRQHIYLIMKEAINNLVKYSECNKAKIEVWFSHSTLHIRIKDNGKGTDFSTHHGGNGLQNMKYRTSEIKGEINIKSEIGKGTEILLEVKIR